ncbi:MAG: hypothetical protein H8E24_08945 [Verrucomicrobia bacterium]|nr:hypothetical protein [Verrucomicrobiota bacterium]
MIITPSGERSSPSQSNNFSFFQADFKIPNDFETRPKVLLRPAQHNQYNPDNQQTKDLKQFVQIYAIHPPIHFYQLAPKQCQDFVQSHLKQKVGHLTTLLVLFFLPPRTQFWVRELGWVPHPKVAEPFSAPRE